MRVGMSTGQFPKAARFPIFTKELFRQKLQGRLFASLGCFARGLNAVRRANSASPKLALDCVNRPVYNLSTDESWNKRNRGEWPSHRGAFRASIAPSCVLA